MHLQPITPQGRKNKQSCLTASLSTATSLTAVLSAISPIRQSQATSKELDPHMITHPIIQSLITPNAIHRPLVKHKPLLRASGSPADDYQYQLRALTTDQPKPIMNRLTTRGRKLNLCHKWLVSRAENEQTRESVNPTPDTLFQTSDHEIKSNPRQGIWGNRSSGLLRASFSAKTLPHDCSRRGIFVIG
jgi:hypothetical protein